MPKKLQIALMCVAVAGNAAAVYLTVTPNEASDYIFTIPTSTNHICGKVIDPDHPYGVIRSEDLCWTWEALVERVAIADGAVPTSRFSHVQGARVRQTHTKFTGFLPGYIGDWLDPAAPLIGNLPVVYEAAGYRTNTWTYADGVYGYTNSITVISMPMTNGTVSAYTNAWTEYAVTGRVNTIYQDVTTIHMLGPDMLPLPLATNITHHGTHIMPNTGPIFDTAHPRAHVFKEMFKWLRATQRLDDPMISVTNNGVRCVTKIRYADGRVSTSQTTNSYLFAYYSCSSNAWSSYDYPDPFKLYGNSRFTSALVTTGGVLRVEIEAAYLLIGFMYQDAEAGGSGLYERHSGQVAARLQTFEMDTSGDHAVVVVTVTPEYLREAGAFAYNLPQSMPTGDYFAPVGHRIFWQSTVDGLAVVYKVTPSARFENN